MEHEQLIGDFQAHVKNYGNTDSPSQDSFHHQQFTNLLPGYIVGAGGFVKCDKYTVHISFLFHFK